MTTNTVRGLASVIIPCWNQLEFTRKCIPALFRQTGPNWELVVINNGSTDGTGDYLAGAQDTSPVPARASAPRVRALKPQISNLKCQTPNLKSRNRISLAIASRARRGSLAPG